MSKERWLAE
jgi:ubiquitin-like modifier-activating enzyme ATG7